MSSLTNNFTFENEAIREENGIFSVYDIIQVLGGQKDPYNVWKRLKKEYPDTVTKCQNIKFHRKDGKKSNKATPGCNREVALEVIGLLPGKVGKKYRREAAKLFCRYLDADPSLAIEVVERQTDNEQLKWIKERTEGKLIRNSFTQTLAECGVKPVIVKGKKVDGFAICTNSINNGVLGKPAKQIKKERHVNKTRDGLSRVELAAIGLAEAMAEEEIKDTSAYGTWECNNKCKNSAKKVSRVFDE